MSALLGLVDGVYAITFGFLVTASSAESTGVNSLFDFVALLLFLIPLLSLMASLWLLLFPGPSERKATLGFISPIGSVVPILFLILLLLRFVFPHRDAPTELQPRGSGAARPFVPTETC